MIYNTKYGYNFTAEAIQKNVNRLTNQLWKLIPMWEHNEDWGYHLDGLILELSGFGNIYLNNQIFLSLLSKLEGIKINKNTIEFSLYRKTVFEVISMLREIIK